MLCLCFKLSVNTTEQNGLKLLVYKVKNLQYSKINLLLKNIFSYKFTVAYVYSVHKFYSSVVAMSSAFTFTYYLPGTTANPTTYIHGK
jgi:hypothetical protein